LTTPFFGVAVFFSFVDFTAITQSKYLCKFQMKILFIKNYATFFIAFF